MIVCISLYYFIYKNLTWPNTIFLFLLFYFILFFEREFQLMVSAPNDSSLSSDQDTNQFLV